MALVALFLVMLMTLSLSAAYASSVDDAARFTIFYGVIRQDWPLLPDHVVIDPPLPVGYWVWIAIHEDAQGVTHAAIQPGFTVDKGIVAHEAGHMLSTAAQRRHVPVYDILWQVRGFPGTAAQHAGLGQYITDPRIRWNYNPEEVFAETFAVCIVPGYVERTENFGHPIDHAHACALASMVMLDGYGQ